MVKSLRCLCLLKVSSMELSSFDDLPPGVVKDLKLMKLFNGNYIEYYEDTDSNNVDTIALQTALTIQYDGESWIFQSRSNLSLISCCVFCDASQPALLQFQAMEGELVKITSPFVFVRHWISASWLEIVYGGLAMQLSVYMNTEETSGSGELSFSGSSRSVVFNSILRVDLSKKGTRVLTHRGEGFSLFGHLHYFRNRLDQIAGWVLFCIFACYLFIILVA